MRRRKLLVLSWLFLLGSCSIFKGNENSGKEDKQEENKSNENSNNGKSTDSEEVIKVDSNPGEVPGGGGQENPEDDSEEELTPVELAKSVDNSKENYDINFVANGKKVASYNLKRGSYIDSDDPTINLVPAKQENGKSLIFVGWNTKEKARIAYSSDDLAPAVRDVTYYAQYKEIDSYKLTIRTICKVAKTNRYNLGDTVLYYPKDNAQVNLSGFEKYLPNISKVESDFQKENKLPDRYKLKMINVFNVSKDNSQETIDKYTLNSRYKDDDLYEELYNNSSKNTGFRNDKLPELKSDLILNCFYETNDKLFFTKFLSEEKIIGSYGYSGGYAENHVIKNVYGKSSPDYSDSLVQKCVLPTKFVGNKSYKFKGWVPYNTSEDKSKSQAELEASARSFFELDDVTNFTNFTYKAVFSTTEYDETCLTYLDSNGNPSYLTYDQLVSSGFITVNNGDLSTNMNSPAFADNLDKLNNSINCVISLPADKGIKSISSFKLLCLTEIVLPSGLTSIGSNAFKESTNLEFVTNNSTDLKTIGESAFEKLGKLAVFRGLDSVSSIGKKAFNYCAYLDLSGNVINAETIGDSAFYVEYGKRKVNNEEITFSENLTYIGSNAFRNRGVTKINFSDSSEKLQIQELAFGNTTLTSIELPNNLDILGAQTYQENNIFYETPLSSITSRGQKFVSINNSLIRDNTLLIGTASSIIPNSVTAIETRAFRNVSIKKIRIPKTVTSIGSNAFDLSGITRIDFEGTYDEFVSKNYKGTSGIAGVKNDILICCSDKVITITK